MKFLSFFDIFSIKEVPKTTLGGIVTIKICIASIIYGTFLYLMQIRQEPIKEVSTEWTLGSGPFLIGVTCTSDECRIHNYVTKFNTFGMSEHVPDVEKSCISLSKGMTYVMHIIYTLNFNEGIFLTWSGNSSPTLESQIRCLDAYDKGCVQKLNLPVLPGVINLNYVQTHNYTEISPAIDRNEWFMNTITNSMPIDTMCDLIGQNTSTTHIQLNSLYNIVKVSQSFRLIDYIGTLGGAISIIMGAGSILLSSLKFVQYMYTRNKSNPTEDTQP